MFKKSKDKQLSNKSTSKKDNSNYNNTISLEEKENKEKIEKNKSKKKNENKSDDIKQKNFSKEANEDNKNLFSGKKIKKKKDEDNSSSLKIKKNKKKKYSEYSSGNLEDSVSNSNSIEKKPKKKVNKKKNKKTKNPDNESDSSSSSNYHPEDHNYLLELLPYLSSPSEDEIIINKKGNITEKSNDDKTKKGKEGKNNEKIISKEEKTAKKEEKEEKTAKKEEKTAKKEEKTAKKEEKEENKIIIELNEKYNNTKNINSINYYTKIAKINKEDELPSYDYIELKNSDDILLKAGTTQIYDCKNKKIKLKIDYDFRISDIVLLKDNYFIYSDSFETEKIFIFHFEEFNTKMVIDQEMDLPENIEFDPYGPPIAPWLACYPLNDNYIIFKWSGNNNFYIYKNNSKEKNKFKFEEYKNIKLNKKAFVYINTSLEKIMRLNDNEFCTFARSDQRPNPQFLFQAFMQGNKKHKEATYIAVYSFNSSKGQFEITKSKINYEKGVDFYGFEVNLLRKRFIFYEGNKQKRTGKLVQVFDLKTMEIIYIFENTTIKFYNISEEKDTFFIIKNDNLYEQYQIDNNGSYKKIGEAKFQNLSIERKYKNGILYSFRNKDYYLLTHE